MKRYYIRHKIKVGDITHLSDQDSERVISGRWHNEEDLIEAECPNELYLGRITFIDKASVEIEIIKFIKNVKNDTKLDEKPVLIILQSLSNERKFDYFLEKAVEIGVTEIYPVESEYSLLDAIKAKKLFKHWNEIIKSATEQSRNPRPTHIIDPNKLNDIDYEKFNDFNKICLSTEQVERQSIGDAITKGKSVVVAVGPEKGWSSSDLKILKKNGFKFVSLGQNILRTETCGLVIASIFNFINKIFDE